MFTRRKFVAQTAVVLAAPFVLRNAAIAQTARVRRDVTKLQSSDPFFAHYAAAVKKLHELPANDQRNWRNQSLIHLNHCKHGSPEFPHWHRHYVANFEAICAQMIGVPDFALPYWNWAADRGRIPGPLYDLNELNVTFWNDPSNASSPNWGPVSTVGTRNLAKGQGLQDDMVRGGAFLQSNIDSILRLTTYNTFYSSLERSPHNNGHVIGGGDRGHFGSGMSPLDPIFWLHHCNVDRLWAQWQAAGNTTPALSGNYAGQFVNAAGSSVTNATSTNALSVSNFNYNYDLLTTATVAPLSKRLNLQSFDNQTIVKPAAVTATMEVLGGTKTQKTAAMRTETRIPVQTKGLLNNMFKSRAYWATDVLGVRRVAVESGRILARLTDVMGPMQHAPMIVNVFVNCPYLSPETGYEDQHYAGSFSFFGPAGHNHGDIYIDVTAPLRKLSGEGQLATENVNVQLMPLPIGKLADDVTLSVGAVELLSA